MKRKALTAVLVVPLLAAVLYALWPTADVAQPAVPPAGAGRGEGVTQSPQRLLKLGAQPLANRESATPSVVPATAPSTSPTGQLAAPSSAAADDSTSSGDDVVEQPPPKAPPHPLNRDGIRGAIHEKLPELQDCYEAWLQQNPELGGTLALSFQIAAADGGGVVQHIAILDGGFGHRAFEGCVGNVFEGLDFEEPEGGAMNVTYPLMFSTEPPP